MYLPVGNGPEQASKRGETIYSYHPPGAPQRWGGVVCLSGSIWGNGIVCCVPQKVLFSAHSRDK
eukprot:1820055-Prymnesium_polylepis.2